MATLCFILMLVSLVFLIFAQLQHILLMHAIFKMICSFLFLGVAYFSHKASSTDKHTTYCKIIIISLFFCMLGDFFLIFNADNRITFIFGAVSFAIAHIMISCSFFHFGKLSIYNVCWTMFFSAIAIFLICQENLISAGDMKPVLIIYAIIISFMVAKSFTLWQYRKENCCFVYTTILAAILFFISDAVLLFALFPLNGPNNLAVINSIIYYISVALFGFSLKKELII